MPMMIPRFALPLVFVAVSLPCSRASFATSGNDPGGGKVVALVGGRILTQTDRGAIEGTILIRDGRIEAVGASVEIPDEAEQIDVTGLVVTPGLIDARSVLWLPDETARDSGNDGSLNILDGVDPFAEDWVDVARSGVTAVAVQPSNNGLLGGRGAVLRVGPGGPGNDLTIRADAFVQAALGVNSTSGNSVLRYQQFEQLKRTLDGVKRYREQWEKYEKDLASYNEKKAKAKADEDKKEEKKDSDEKKEGSDEGNDDSSPRQDEDDEEKESDETAGSSADDKEDEAKKDDGPPRKPERDETNEFLVGLLKGEVPLRIEIHREDDFKNALALADEFGLTLIVEGLSDPGSARETIVSKRMPMVLGPILESGARPSYRRSRDRSWPSGLPADDSRWAIGTFGTRPADSALLRSHAATAVARGIPRDQALRALTLGAAEVLGLSDELGSIAEGHRADLAVFGGDPIDPSTPVALVLSGGEVVYHDESVSPVEESPEEVADLDLPDRLPSRFVLKSTRIVGEDGSMREGALLIVDGVIESSGETVDAGGEVPVFDAGNSVVTPGLLTAHSTLGQARAAAESAGADAGFLRAVDAFDPTGRTVRSMIRGGVLRAGFAPVPINVIAGAIGAVRLGADEPVVEPVAGMSLVLSSTSRSLERFPVSLTGQVSLVRQFLGLEEENTPDVRRILDYYLSDAAIDRLDAERRARAELLREGRCGAMFEVEDSAEVTSALDLAEELDICVGLVGPGAIEDQTDRIARVASEGPGVVLVLRPMPSGPEASRRWSSVVEVVASGAGLRFAADDPEELRMLAASLVAAGLPRSEAIRALAIRSAVGMESQEEPWASGSPADFVLWNGSPLNLSSRPILVVVDGRIVP